MAEDPIDWNIGEQSGLVSIGTHRLYIEVGGPDRLSHNPVLVVLPGVTNTITSWRPFQRLISPHARIVTYDRSGLGRSEASPARPSSTSIAQDLQALLQATKIAPPYILIGHSWGGILAQEFLSLAPQDVAGLVFVDASQHRYFELIPFTDPALRAMFKDVDWFEAIGLRDSTVLSQEEYRAYLDEQPTGQHDPRSALEFQALMESFEISRKRGFFDKDPPVLGNRPVCVVKGHNDHDITKAFEAGIQAGNGTDEQRTRFQEILGSWEKSEVELQREFLKLSSNGKYMEAEQSAGHNVHMIDPLSIVAGVRWTLHHLCT